MKQNKFSKIKALNFALLLAFIIAGCASETTMKTGTAEEVFKQGLEEFNDEDYIEAEKYFKKITLQFPASAYADDAYYYLAEVNYKKEMFIVAAHNYGSLRRTHPQSEYAKQSLYKTAMCFYEMSPSFDRDQDYTIKAIRAFSEFQAVYPDDSLSQKATQTIIELRNKLAEKEFATASLYLKLKDYAASVIYFDKVIENFQDTDFFEKAYYEKIKALAIMGNKDEVISIIDLYKKTFPPGERMEEIKSIETSIRK